MAGEYGQPRVDLRSGRDRRPSHRLRPAHPSRRRLAWRVRWRWGRPGQWRARGTETPLSEITRQSRALSRGRSRRSRVTFGGKWFWRFLCGAITDGDVGLSRAEDDLSEEVEFG